MANIKNLDRIHEIAEALEGQILDLSDLYKDME